jgi:hypothetical protein
MLKARGEVPALQRETETVDIGAPLSGVNFSGVSGWEIARRVKELVLPMS